MRIRALGGATGHWEGWCRPLMPHDFEARDYIPNSGWPIRYPRSVAVVCARVRDAGDRAVSVGRRGARQGDGNGGAADRRRDRSSVLPVQPADPLCPCVWRGAREGRERSRDCACQRHRHSARQRTADVSSRSRAGRSQRRNSTYAPIDMCSRSAGLKTPACCLRRDRSSRKESRMAYDVVGRYFMEHPHYYGAVGLVHAAKRISGSTHECRRISSVRMAPRCG